MNRRDFLFLRKAHGDTAELSCEQLFMRCVDSTLDGTTSELFGHLEQTLARVTSLHLTDVEWLSCEELKPLDVMLMRFRERGGLVISAVERSKNLATAEGRGFRLPEIRKPR